MPFENVEQVLEERDPASVNKRFAEGWTLLAIVPGFDPANGQSFTCYVLGKVVSAADKAARLVRERRGVQDKNEFL
ncbi:hypothetical protein [Pseudomonas viridiflava]|uniref:hypothetical protein n=1 Tax=Pseudomonas viridiflava TaxID=33069 RepID=UPI002EAF346D|nr:hypothetical protein [Pseudomonas viridiflava]MEE3929830.1 hypothetical protein [Pseudomonas viridiflava]MEE3941013.1 hypothetical protein [Pseudomonas viridiflava]MEE3967023.1 hypothetical protein [Pseudomonas viridiflava]MEE3980201.1 hypothetical protein [Pseudomonas viridiflava]